MDSDRDPSEAELRDLETMVDKVSLQITFVRTVTINGAVLPLLIALKRSLLIALKRSL